MQNLQIMYKDTNNVKCCCYCTRHYPDVTKESLKEMKFSKIKISKLLGKLQNNSIRGTVEICKTFMKFSES